MSWQVQFGSLLRWSKVRHALRHKRASFFRRRSLRLEPLETRTLLSIDANFMNGVLSITDNIGEANALTLSIDAGTGNILVNDAVGVTPLSLSLVVVNPNTVRCNATVTQIVVSTGALDDSLTLDFAEGNPIPSNVSDPTHNLYYDGGAGGNNLILMNGMETSDVYSPGPAPGSGKIDITAGAADGTGDENFNVLVGSTIRFQNLWPVLDIVPGPATVNGTPAANAINYTQGAVPTDGLVTVDNFESYEFSGKSSLTINGLAGSDEINLNNPNTPTDLTAIIVDGGDPTASDRLVVNGTSATETINYAPDASVVGKGTVTITGLPPVNFTTVEELAINGQGGDDTLVYTSPANAGVGSGLLYTPGVSSDSGSIIGNRLVLGFALVGSPLTPLSFNNLGTSGRVRFDTANGGRTDLLNINGTAHSDSFSVTALNGGTVGIISDGISNVPIQTPAVRTLALHGLEGDDVFTLAGELPYSVTVIDGGDPSASDIMNLTGATGAVTVDIADSALLPTPTNTTITGYGGTVVLIGVEVANLDANDEALTAVGTSRDDVITYTPTGAAAGTFQAAGVNTVVNFTAVGGDFTVQGGSGGNADELVVQGTNARDLFKINQSTGSVQVLANNVTARKTVELDTTVEVLTALGLLGEDTFQVIPAVGSGSFPLDNLLINVDGGDPESSDALVVAALPFGSSPGSLPADQFVVVNRGRDPNSGTVRVFAGGTTQFPDINYKNVETVAPLVASTAGIPNLLIMAPDLFEPNDFQSVAAFLGSGSTLQIQHATIFPNSVLSGGGTDQIPTNLENPGVPADQDYYRVVAQDTGTLDFQVYFKLYNNPLLLPAGGNLALEVLDVDGTIIGKTATPAAFGAVGAAADARIRIPAVAGQSYYLHVFGANADGTPNAAVINGYDATIINTPPPVPYALELLDNPVGDPPPANSDTGRSQFDNVTRDSTPTLVFRLDDAVFRHDLPGNPADDTPPAGLIPLLFRAGPAQSTLPGFAIAIFDEGSSPPPGTQTGTAPQTPLGFATATAQEGVYQFTSPALSDGSHFLTARVQLIDPATPQQTGFGDRSLALEIVVDTDEPPVFFGSADVGNDGLSPEPGVTPQPGTFVDQKTNNTTPTFWGTAEADAVIRVFADLTPDNGVDNFDVLLGLTVAVPEDGTNQFPNGQWHVTSTVDLNDPAFFPLDGLRRILVTAEDPAGNVNPGAEVAAQALEIFVDTQGPQINKVFIDDGGNFDLFDPKPTSGPTPLVNALGIYVVDLPGRDAGFLNPALNPTVAVAPGHYLLRGDANGIIPIESIDFTQYTITPGQSALAKVTLNFFAPLPDDRYTLTLDDNLVDDVGNKLDGESDAAQPLEQPTFTSGDGQPGGDFVARFTVDSRPEIGAWAGGSVYVDINGNFTYDPTNLDFVNRDLTFTAGYTSDYVFAGKFNSTTTGFDTLAAYGKAGGGFRWLIDFNANGVFGPGEAIPEPSGIIGMPVAGDFNNDPADGDEVGLFNGAAWFLDTNPPFGVDRQIATALRGLPIVGDFDGDGNFDLGTYSINPVNTFSFLLGPNFTGEPIVINAVNQFGFIGVRARPVAADMDQDGITDVGLWVPDRAGATQEHVGEWYFLISNDLNKTQRLTGTVNTLGHPFSTTPLGHDLFARFGNEFAVPVVGNFDPPVSSQAAGTPGTPSTPTPASIGVFSDGNWYLDTNGDQRWSAQDDTQQAFGFSGATPVVGDWNGDGKKEIGAYNNGAWWLDTDGNGAYDQSDAFFYYGWQGATPVVGDWNGDGTDEVGVYNLGVWFRDVNGNRAWDASDQAAITYYGWGGATPVVGDWNGDGKDDLGVYNIGAWFRDVNGNNQWDEPDQAALAYYGWDGATPVVGDWNGDGQDEIGVYSLGAWLRDVNGNNQWDAPDQAAVGYLGWSGARPVVGNWTTPGSALLAAEGPAGNWQNRPALSPAELQPIVTEALARWSAAGLSAPALAAMKQAQFVVTDLPGSYLGLAEGGRVYLDRDAAGHGWFIDPTPAGDEEFAWLTTGKDSLGVGRELRAIDPRAVDRIDLVSVVEHELGHIAGLRDNGSSLDDIMSGHLSSGIRRTV